MTDQFLGEIRPLCFNFPPFGWALCNGQILSISQNSALFALLGTQYGGNGTSTFALPDLQSRVPMHSGTNVNNGMTYTQGEAAGVEMITLSLQQMPSHNHTFVGTADAANSEKPVAGAALALVHHQGGSVPDFYYAPDTTPQPINAGSLSMYGSGLPHTNVQPYLTINWCIALQGIFPARN
jgi:microcystin-dependent protein